MRFIAIILLGLTGCNSLSNPITLSAPRTALTPVPDLPPLSLETFEFDWPRLSQPIRKNTPECTNNSSPACQEYPIDLTSNLFIGLTQDNWERLMRNIAKFVSREGLYNQRISEINRQRRELNGNDVPRTTTENRQVN